MFSAGAEPDPQVYRPSLAPLAMTIVAHVRGEAGDRVAAVRDAVQSVDPKVPVFNVKTMEERLDMELARPRLYTLAVLFFGGLGLLLAVMGVYGVVSYSILQRTREMGIRLALGTTPTILRATMLRQTLPAVVTCHRRGRTGSRVRPLPPKSRARRRWRHGTGVRCRRPRHGGRVGRRNLGCHAPRRAARDQ